MLNSLLRHSSVNIKLTEVAIAAACPAPHFIPLFIWLHGHLLFQGGLALIFDHYIIQGLFTVRIVIDLEVFFQILKELPQLVQFVSRPSHFGVVC